MLVDSRALFSDLAALLVSLTLIATFLWKVILKPHVTRFVESVNKVERAVTVNGHQDPANPTMLDEFADVRRAQARMESNQRRIEDKLDRHIRWADRQVLRIDAIEEQHNREEDPHG